MGAPPGTYDWQRTSEMGKGLALYDRDKHGARVSSFAGHDREYALLPSISNCVRTLRVSAISPNGSDS